MRKAKGLREPQAVEDKKDGGVSLFLNQIVDFETAHFAPAYFLLAHFALTLSQLYFSHTHPLNLSHFCIR